MKENVTTPAGQEAIVSMLGNPEAFKMCVCALRLYQACVDCAHVYLVGKSSVPHCSFAQWALSAFQATKAMLAFSKQ